MFNFKKSKDNTDWQYVYTIHDKVSKKHIGLFYSPTDEAMIRTSLPTVLMDYPFRDIEVVRVGRFEINTGILDSLSLKVIPLDKYLFPHSRLSPKGENLPIEELDDSMKKFKAQQSEKVTEENKKTAEDSAKGVVNE